MQEKDMGQIILFGFIFMIIVMSLVFITNSMKASEGDNYGPSGENIYDDDKKICNIYQINPNTQEMKVNSIQNNQDQRIR